MLDLGAPGERLNAIVLASEEVGEDIKTVDQDKQTTRAVRHRAHARVTNMEALIAETPADNIEGVGIKLALYVYT